MILPYDAMSNNGNAVTRETESPRAERPRIELIVCMCVCACIYVYARDAITARRNEMVMTIFLALSNALGKSALALMATAFHPVEGCAMRGRSVNDGHTRIQVDFRYE